MTDSDNSAVSIVAIIAIVILVGGGLYFILMQRSGDTSPTIEVDIDEVPVIDGSRAVPLPARIAFLDQRIDTGSERAAVSEAIARFG